MKETVLEEQDNELSPKISSVISLLPYISSMFFGLIQLFRLNITRFGYISVYGVCIMTLLQLMTAFIYLVLSSANRNRTIAGKKLIDHGYHIAMMILTVILCGCGVSLGKPYIRDVFSGTQTVSTCFYYDFTESLYVLDHEGELPEKLYLTAEQKKYIDSLDVNEEEKIVETVSFGTVRSRRPQIDIEYYPDSGVVRNVSESP